MARTAEKVQRLWLFFGERRFRAEKRRVVPYCGVFGRKLCGTAVAVKRARFLAQRPMAAYKSQKGIEGARVRVVEVSFGGIIRTGERGLVPEDRFSVPSAFAENAPDLVADAPARHPVRKARKEGGERAVAVAVLFAAGGEHFTRLDFIDVPTVARKHFGEDGLRLRVEAVVEELSPVIEQIARTERLFGAPLLIDMQIARAALLVASQMGHGEIVL